MPAASSLGGFYQRDSRELEAHLLAQVKLPRKLSHLCVMLPHKLGKRSRCQLSAILTSSCMRRPLLLGLGSPHPVRLLLNMHAVLAWVLQSGILASWAAGCSRRPCPAQRSRASCTQRRRLAHCPFLGF